MRNEQHAPSVLNESKPMAAARCILARRWAEQEQIGALFEPTIAGGEWRQQRLADHRDGLEVEASRACCRPAHALRQDGMQRRSRSATAYAASAARKRAAGQAFLVGLFGELFYIN